MKLRHLLMVILIITCPLLVFSQWQQTNGPGIGTGLTSHAIIDAIGANDSFLIATSHAPGFYIYRSLSDGQSWDTVARATSTQPNAALVFGNKCLVANQSAGIQYSNNSGATWSNLSLPFAAFYMVSCYRKENDIFAHTYGNGLYVSHDTGTTWFNLPSTISSVYVLHMTSTTNSLFAASDTGLYYSPNNGVSWSHINHPGGAAINYIGSIGNRLFLFSNSIFYSDDNGANWVQSSSGIPSTNVSSMVVAGTVGFIAAGDVYATYDLGNSWVSTNAPGFTCLAVNSNNLYAGSSGGFSGVWRYDLSSLLSANDIDAPEKHDNVFKSFYPNPCHIESTIKLELPEGTQINVNLYSTDGKLVKNFYNTFLQKGVSYLKINLEGIAQGNYCLSVQQDAQIETKNITVY